MQDSWLLACFDSWHAHGQESREAVTNFLAPGTSFMEDNFSLDGIVRMGLQDGLWFWDNLSALHLFLHFISILWQSQDIPPSL